MKKQKKIKKVKVQKINPKPAVKNPADIIRTFQDLIKDADSYTGKDYKKYWEGLKKTGPEMLGITKAILEELEKAIKTIKELDKKLQDAEPVRFTENDPFKGTDIEGKD